MYFAITREDIACNVNHVAFITEYYLKKLQDRVLNYILQYNLLFCFLKHLKYELVSNIYLIAFGLSREVQLTSENTKRIYEYCRITGFFKDLAQAILKGETGLNPEKLKEGYKPTGVSALIKTVKDEKFSEPNSLNASPIKNLKHLPEEDPDFLTDIDQVRELLREGPKPNLKLKNKVRRSMQMAEKQKANISNSSARETKSKFSQQDESIAPTLSVDTKIKKESTIDSKKTNSPLITAQRPSFDRQQSQSKFTRKLQVITNYPQSRGSIVNDTLSKDSPSIPGSPFNTIHQQNDMSMTSSRFKTKPSNVSKTRLANPYVIDESMDKILANELTELYPSATKVLVETPLDREAKGEEFTPNQIIKTEAFALPIAELLLILVQQAIQDQENGWNDTLQLPKLNTTLFWRSAMDIEGGIFFQILLKVIMMIWSYIYKSYLLPL